MRPIRLEMCGFGPYARREVINFRELQDRNFFLIHGPTGSGKTAILDAICFVLYGHTSGAERDARDMRSHYADDGTPTQVVLDFAVGKKLYRVERNPAYPISGRKTDIPPDAALWDRTELTLDDPKEGRVIATKVTAVTQAVEDILGFKADQFRQVVMLPQGRFREVLTADSADRRNIMQILFGTEAYRQIEQHLKDEAKGVEDRLNQHQDRLDTLLKQADVESLDELKTALEKLAEDIKAACALEKTAEKAAQKAMQALEKGSKDAEKLKEVSDAAKALEALRKQEREFSTKQLEHDLGRKAQASAGPESLYMDAKSNLKKLQESAAISKEHLSNAEKQAAEAAEKLAQEKSPTKEQKREASRQKISRLEALKGKVTAIAEAKTVLDDAKVKAAESDSLLKSIEHKKLNTQKQLENTIQEQDKTQKTAGKLPGFEASLQLLEQDFAKVKNAAKLLAEFKEKEQAHKETASIVKALESKLKQAKAEVKHLEELWISEGAFALASNLEPGTPCPVCGSLEHPNPLQVAELEDIAAATDHLPTRERLAAARKHVESLEKEYDALQKEVSKRSENLAGLKGRLDAVMPERTVPVEEPDLRALTKKLEKGLTQTKAQVAEAHTALEKATKLKDDAETLKRHLTKIEEELDDTRELKADTDAKLAASAAKLEEREQGVPDELQSLQALQKAILAEEAFSKALQDALEKAEKDYGEKEKTLAVAKSGLTKAESDVEAAWKTLDERLKAFNSAWRQSGFSDVEAYRSAKRTENALKILADAVKSYQEDIHALKNRLERAQKAAEGLKEPDLEKLKIAADESYRLSREAVEFRAKLEQTAKDQTRLMGALEKVYGEMAELEGEYGVLTRIANVAGGKHPNTLGMNFETFILAAMLDQVAEAASHRLQIMSKGRYSLKRTLERRTARSAGGLGLEVFDMYTGRERSVTTLSGGEGFMASLSLALGLADVVQAASGGIHLDTIFIDEGFGALDPEALDLALDTLIRLQKDSGRIVGVISHVPELAERIDTRLKVEMTDMGSKTRFIVD